MNGGNTRRRETLRIAGVALAVSVLLSHSAALGFDSAHASTVFRASIGHGGGFGGSVTFTGATPQEVPYQTVTGGLNVIASGSARADRGELELLADDLGTAGPQQDQWSASSHFRAEDVVISGPQGVTQVASSINLVVDGAFIVVRPNGEAVNASLDLTAEAAFVAFQTLHWDGPLGSSSVQEAIVVDSGTYPVGTPIPALELTVSAATAMTAPSCCAHAQVDFQTGSRGVHFPIGSPVFNLPPGFTVNSPTLDIVDNIWGGSATGVADAPTSSIEEFVGRTGTLESAAFRLSLTEAAEITLRVVDVEGRSVGVVAREFALAGTRDYSLGVLARRPLASGIYFGVVDVRARGGAARQTARLAIIR